MRIKKMTRAALFAALICVCAWLSIPAPPLRYTLQTFGIYLALLTLGGRWGSRSVGLYLALGAVGLPVFSGFRGGLGALLDVTGGYLWGFLLGAWAYRLLEGRGRALALGACVLCQYLCALGWFCLYTGSTVTAGILVCVVPYLLPDAIKLLLARSLARSLRRSGVYRSPHP